MIKRLLLTSFIALPLQLFAAEQPVLTVYTYDSFTSQWGPGAKLKTQFEQFCECQVKYESLSGSATLLNRIKLEGPNSPADVVIGLDNNLMQEAKDSDLFAKTGVDTSKLTLPLSWTSSTFIPYDYGYFAMIYDSEIIKNPPTSLNALIEDALDYKIILIDPRTSTPGLGMLLWMKNVFGDDAAAKWTTLQSKTLTTTGGWSEAYFNLFLEGAAPMVLSYTTSPAYHMAIDNTDRYQAAAFSEGHYLQIELAAITKNSKQKTLAEQFLQTLLSKDFQQHLPLSNVMFPVVELGDALPEAFNHLIVPTHTLHFSAAEVANKRKSWIDEWLEAVSK